jgi:SAM-dependent methyltransferase
VTPGSLRRRLAALNQETRSAGDRFLACHRADVDCWTERLTASIHLARERLRQDVAEISGDDAMCLRVVGQANEYVDWLQWSLWDLPYFAVAIRPEPGRFQRRTAACAMVYFAGRIFDDVLDRHFWYKAKRPTLFALATEQHPSSEGAESLTILTGLLLCAEGLLRLADPADADYLLLLQKVLASFRRAVIGAIMENADRESWSLDYYERLIQLKNVDFWRCLYSAVDPRRDSPLYPFFERYYALAQKLNDILDFPEDERRAQPNLVSLHLHLRRPAVSAGEPPRRAGGIGSAVPPAAEELLAAEFLALRKRAADLPDLERSIALLKLGESLREAFRLGLFAPPARPAAAAPVAAAGDGDGAPALGLHWLSQLGDVVERAGAAALERVDCAVCGGSRRRRLFEKQGFTYHRCLDCSHVYVSPRISLELQLRMGAELERQDQDNDFLEVQSIFAEPLCHLLRLRARGPRLLDLGFGRGYLLKLAHAYGFETYGLDSSIDLTGQVAPELGRRVCRGSLGLDRIPWGAFDVVVMSHVAEHLADPGAVLREVRQRLNPGGVLCIAVPDTDSLQLRIFGKNWDVMSPLVHFQYFNEASLSRLVGACGFENLERLQYPPLPKELTPKWMRLMRRLGGDESGELAMFAQRPMSDPAVPQAGPAAVERGEAGVQGGAALPPPADGGGDGR